MDKDEMKRFLILLALLLESTNERYLRLERNCTSRSLKIKAENKTSV